MNITKTKELLKKHKADIIVIASLLLISILVLLVVTLTRVNGAAIKVTVNGEVVGEYPLAIDNVYKLNGGTNILTVKGGIAYMSYSNCPDHVCENTGKVKYVGEMIVCLPNNISITVVGNDENGVDFVS